MKILVGYPPNYEEIIKKFDLRNVKPVFAYGDIIYNPHNCPIADHILVHEKVHEKQQLDTNFITDLGVKQQMTPKIWWKLYLEDKGFRLEQEIPAYQAQFKFVKKIVKDKNVVNNFLITIAKDLSGKMYGNMLSFEQAIQAIKGRE